MKKITYLIATAAMVAACNNSNQGYTVTGSVEGAADGDKVYLMEINKRQEPVKLDSATIKDGKFTFKGRQETPACRYITYSPEQADGLYIDFFLENGTINVQMGRDNDSATGTANNDAYQQIRTEVDKIKAQATSIYETLMTDTTLTDEDRVKRQEELSNLQEQAVQASIDGLKKNISGPVGIHLLKQYYYYMEQEELEEVTGQIPAEYDEDADIAQIKDKVTKMKATAVGQKFTDFEMKTPEGTPVKLSDYVGKGKVVLVDFWASWCGPCRREMPNIVKAYAQYKKKNFEVVGVSLDRDADAWKKAIEELKITWPQMSDLKYWNCEGSRLYAVSSIPHTILIDGDGTILARGLHGEELQQKLEELLK